jgi:glutamate synthase domain-containing protein 2
MNKKESLFLWKALLGSTFITYLGLLILGKPIINVIADSIIKKLMTDSYDENLWEFYSAAKRAKPQTIVETNLRSQEGKVIQRPLGSPKNFPNTDQLLFNTAQLAVMPTPEYVPVDTCVTLGPQAAKPLIINMPIIISGMAFGIGLTEKAKIALAKGASQAGTAINNGEGPFIPSERLAGKKYILLYDRGSRNHEESIIKQADMIEIQFGQGALGGIGHQTAYKDIEPKARELMHLRPGRPSVTHAHVPGIEDPRRDLPKLIKKLQALTGGVPIGAKIAAGHYLEKDLEILLEAGIDFIALDCTGAATKGGPPILEDDFGIPLIYAVNRAANYLRKKGVKDKITLIAGGGLFTPGSFLKALALGADAVYIGSIALFAMAHTQVLKAIPWEPPTQVVFAHSKYGNRLNVNEAAKSLSKFLISCNEEMKEGIRALGKTSLKEVNKSDLVSLDPVIANLVGVPMASESYLK